MATEAEYTQPMAAPSYADITFRGAPATPAERNAVLSGKPPPRQSGHWNPRHVSVIAGSVFLGAIMLPPCLDAGMLLLNPVFVFFVGQLWPTLVLVVTVVLFLVWLCVVSCFYDVPEAEKTGTLLHFLASVLLAVLGVALLLMSFPLERDTHGAYRELFSDCEHGPLTRRLFDYSMVLQGLRSTPQCRDRSSIERCVGYSAADPYTGILQRFEDRYQCAGFCFSEHAAVAATFAINTSMDKKFCMHTPQECVTANTTATRGCCGCSVPSGNCPFKCTKVVPICQEFFSCFCPNNDHDTPKISYRDRKVNPSPAPLPMPAWMVPNAVALAADPPGEEKADVQVDAEEVTKALSSFRAGEQHGESGGVSSNMGGVEVGGGDVSPLVIALRRVAAERRRMTGAEDEDEMEVAAERQAAPVPIAGGGSGLVNAVRRVTIARRRSATNMEENEQEGLLDGTMVAVAASEAGAVGSTGRDVSLLQKSNTRLSSTPVSSSTTTPMPPPSAVHSKALDDPQRGAVVTGVRPLALWTRDEFTASCDGMAAREVKFQGLKVASSLYALGVFLIVMASLGWFLQVLWLFDKKVMSFDFENFPEDRRARSPEN